MILSTIRRQGTLRRLPSLGSMATRARGASVGLVVSPQTVKEMEAASEAIALRPGVRQGEHTLKGLAKCHKKESRPVEGPAREKPGGRGA